jgi:hypothetical protein
MVSQILRQQTALPGRGPEPFATAQIWGAEEPFDWGKRSAHPIPFPASVSFRLAKVRVPFMAPYLNIVHRDVDTCTRALNLLSNSSSLQGITMSTLTYRPHSPPVT